MAKPTDIKIVNAGITFEPVTFRTPLKFGGRTVQETKLINVEVTVGGMVVRPGDIIVGDQDGLCAFSPDIAEEVIAKALKQRDAEEATMQAIREGRWDRSFVDALEARCMN